MLNGANAVLPEMAVPELFFSNALRWVVEVAVDFDDAPIALMANEKVSCVIGTDTVESS